MKINSEDIKSGLFFTAFVLFMLWVGYEFGGKLLTKIENKRTLDSLRMENLLLDIELKKHKLKLDSISNK